MRGKIPFDPHIMILIERRNTGHEGDKNGCNNTGTGDYRRKENHKG